MNIVPKITMKCIYVIYLINGIEEQGLVCM